MIDRALVLCSVQRGVFECSGRSLGNLPTTPTTGLRFSITNP